MWSVSFVITVFGVIASGSMTSTRSFETCQSKRHTKRSSSQWFVSLCSPPSLDSSRTSYLFALALPQMFAFNVSSRELEREYVKQEAALRIEEEKTETKRRMRKRELELRRSASQDLDHPSHVELSTNHAPHDDHLPSVPNHPPDAQLPTNHTSSQLSTGHTP